MPSFRRKNNYISRNNKRQRVGPLWSRARARLARRKNVTTNRGITVQHDTRQVYRRKRMPRRKRRIWKRFVKKVQWVDEKNLGTRTVLFNVAKQVNNSSGASHGYTSLCLYGWQSTSTTQPWFNDIKYMANLENKAAQSTANDMTVPVNARMFFHSAVLDVTIRNVSFFSVGGAIDPNCTLEVDVYQCSASKEFDIDGTNLGDFTGALDYPTAGIYDNNTAALGTAINLGARGSTPFEMTKALSMFGIKIWKKTKYYLASNQTMTFQVRDPKRHVFYRDKVDGLNNGCNMPGITRFFYIVFKAVPGITIDASNTTESIWMGVTRKYMYKVEGLNEDRSIKITG